jgi:hypothetical protein
VKQLADGVWQLSGFPPNSINVLLLEPKLVLVGHGPPYRDTKKFVDFCAALPD